MSELKKYSDSVLVILNDKLREIYHNLKVSEAFAHADNVLSSAAKCIAELINVALRINVDFNDVRRVMENSGVAIMGSAMGSGEGRSLKAVTEALNSPLLNDNDIRGARYVLVSITCGAGKDELTMDELAEITDYIQEAAGQTAEMIKGYGTDEILGDKVSVTIIASGFDRKNTDLGLSNSVAQPEIKMLHLEENKPVVEKKIEVKAEEKIEVSKITEPMLKANVVADKSVPEVKKEMAPTAEIKKEEPQIEIKKVEKHVEAKHIEVKLDPVVAPVAETKKEEPKVEVVAEAKIEPPHVEAIPFVAEVIAPVLETPVVIESIAENKAEEIEQEEPASEPFLLVKEKEQISFEFDMTIPVAQSNETPVVKKEEVPSMQAPVETKPETVAPVNMEVKRTFAPTAQKENLRASEVGADSKVTKIADVQLNSLPPISDNDARAKAQEKIQKLRELSFKVKTPGGLAELENEPAYKRKNVVLNDNPHSSDSDISRFTLGTEDKKPSLRPDNSFLHDKPD